METDRTITQIELAIALATINNLFNVERCWPHTQHTIGIRRKNKKSSALERWEMPIFSLKIHVLTTKVLGGLLLLSQHRHVFCKAFLPCVWFLRTC